MLRRFIRANVAACDWIESFLPAAFTRSLQALHERTTAALINRPGGAVVVDVGGGHLCPFAARRDPALEVRILALDILESQLRANRVVDWKVVGDACRTLPLKDDSVDVVVSRSVLEHLPDTAAFLSEAARVIRPGGSGIHIFPARNAPFALINRALPDRLSRAVLHFFFPEWKAECGFPAHYDRCTWAEMEDLARRQGLEIAEGHRKYYQSIYFKFFLPLYVLSLAYDLALWTADVRPLASQILLVVRKPAPRPSA